VDKPSIFTKSLKVLFFKVLCSFFTDQTPTEIYKNNSIHQFVFDIFIKEWMQQHTQLINL